MDNGFGVSTWRNDFSQSVAIGEAEFSQTFHRAAVASSVDFVGQWHVTVVHRFHCRSDVSRCFARPILCFPRASRSGLAAPPLWIVSSQDLLVSFTYSVMIFFVSPLSARRSSRTTPWSQFAGACGSPFVLVVVLLHAELADVSLEEGRLGCESSALCPLSSVFTSASFKWAASCEVFLISELLCCHKGSMERRTKNCVRSKASGSMSVRASTGSSAGADTHTPVHVTLWCIVCF